MCVYTQTYAAAVRSHCRVSHEHFTLPRGLKGLVGGAAGICVSVSSCAYHIAPSALPPVPSPPPKVSTRPQHQT
eukprot:6564776-Prymnesium_polylepis.1